jgi:hypothetical protein
MDRARDEPGHSAAVDAWIAQAIDDALPAEVIADLFRVALESLWQRAVTALGSVTLTAIADRVLSTATKRYSFLAAINPQPNSDARPRQLLRDRLVLVPRPELLEGLRFALIELLTVIGRLTAEILSPDLHAALSEVTATTSDSRAPALHALPTQITGKAQS